MLDTGRIEAARTRLRLMRSMALELNGTAGPDLEAALEALDGYQRVRDAMEAYLGDESHVVTAEYVLRLLDGKETP